MSRQKYSARQITAGENHERSYFAGFWLLLCIGGLFIGWGIQSEYSYEPLGPRPFPLAILSLMALCAALLLLRRPQAVEWPHNKVLQRLLVLVITRCCMPGL